MQTLPRNIVRAARAHPLLIDLGLCAALVILAFALRWPNLATVPPLTDEFKEVGVAVDIVQNHHLPLVGFDAYDGPFFSYLVALAFRLFGLHPELPRLVVLFIGLLTVAATFGLAKELGGRAVGFVAAILLAFNAYHILFNSHVAWSNETTPFFTTIAVWFYLRSTRPFSSKWLIAAGVAFGLAAQTHPSALLLAPAFALDLVMNRDRRRLLRSAAPYLALAAALAAYAPVIYYNLSTGGGSLRAADLMLYAYETAPTFDKALAHISPFLATISLLALGSFKPVSASAAWGDPVVMTCCILTLAALIAWARRGETFALIAVLSAGVLAVIYDRGYGLSDGGRYFQFLLPLVYSTWAWAGIRLWHLASSLRFRFSLFTWTMRAALLALVLLLLAIPLADLRDYYSYSLASGQDNRALLDIVQRARADPGRPILLASALTQLDTGRGGDVGDDLAYLLRLDGRSVQFVDGREAAAWERDLQAHPRVYLIAPDPVVALIGPQTAPQPLVTAFFPCPGCGASNDFTLFDWDLARTHNHSPESFVILGNK